jgi:hypothetical protein
MGAVTLKQNRKTVSATAGRGNKGTFYLGDKQHGRLVAETHYSNPHNTSSILNRVSSSRGFPLWLVRRLPVEFFCKLTGL